MKLSVIIPSYNRASLIGRALDSVIAQELPESISEMEIIVVDDGSTDETVTALAGYMFKIQYIKQVNRGVSAARNAGLDLASGDWVALLDSDDEWLPGKLIKQFALLEQEKLKVCHTEEIWIRKGVRVNQMQKHKKSGGRIFAASLPLCAMSPSSIIIHREVFDDVGGFDEELPACEDYDLWLKITARYSVAFVEQACISKYGGHEDQLSHKHWGMDRFRIKALEDILSSTHNHFLTTEEQQLALSTLLKKLEILLSGARKRDNSKLEKDCMSKLGLWSNLLQEQKFDASKGASEINAI